MNYLLWIVKIFTIVYCSNAVKIIEFLGPTSVRNGSESNIILDCPYILENKEETNGLEVKWFYNKVPYPIYQWIPGNKPQDLIFFKGRLDLSYEASDDPLSKYRALSIINPTTELTADYTCWVSSFESYDFKKRKIVIYSPATDISVTYSNPVPNIILVVCDAHGLYPEPEINLYRGTISSERTRIEGILASTVKDPKKDSYNATIKFQFFDSKKLAEEVFICVVNLPGTDYSIQEEILLYKDPPQMNLSSTKSSSYLILLLSYFVITLALLI